MEKLRTLLLDDESVICDIVKREVGKREGVEPEYLEVPTGTGKEAIELMKKEASPPNLLFIDLRLNNGLTGFDVIDWAVTNFKKDDMKIVILTGCWEGSEDWDKSVSYMNEGKVDALLGKWGIGIVLSEIGNVLDKILGK